jgi:MYXO-CTERM domain-containing protein
MLLKVFDALEIVQYNNLRFEKSQEGQAMKTQKIILPTISVGLLMTAREVTANTVDFGVVAESLVAGGTIIAPGANTIGGVTLGGLTFVGTHLNDVINGQTVSTFLTSLLGPQNSGTASFNILGSQGAAGGFLFNGNYTLVNGGVTLSPVPVTGSLTACTPNTVPGLPGCRSGNTFNVNPYDLAGLITNMEMAQVLALPFGLSNGFTATVNRSITIDFGTDPNGNDFVGHEVMTSFSAVAATPEPTSWSFAALGVAVLGWWRRRLSRRK